MILQDIRQDLRQGALPTATNKINRERKSFPAYCADCAEKLDLVEAELFILQGNSSKVAELICNQRASSQEAVTSAIKRNTLCSLAHINLGLGKRSEQELRQAHELAERIHSPLMGEVLQARSSLAMSHDHFEDARKDLAESLRLAHQQKDSDLEAGDLLDMGYLELQSEHYGEALDWFNASARIARSIHANAMLEADIGNIGWAHYKLGDYEVALPAFVEAQVQARNLGTRLNEIMWRTDAGDCRYELGDLKGAEMDYLAALNEVEATGNQELISGIHASLAVLYLQTGQTGAARQQAAATMQSASASGEQSTELEARFLQARIAERQGDRSEAMRLLDTIYREPGKSNSLKCSIENAAANIAARDHKAHEAETWYRKSVATFETERSAVKEEELRLPFFANGDEIYRNYADFLIATHKPDAALRLLDLGRAKTLSEGLGMAARPNAVNGDPATNPSAIARRQNATLLFYSLGPEKSYLWAMDAKQTRLFVLPRKTDIDARVNGYQKAILKSADPLREADVNAQALYQDLVAPAASMIPNGGKVIIIPDGSLNKLNFETLLVPGKTGLHYWIEDVTLTNANSIRMLSGLTVTVPKKPTLLLVGNPIAEGTDYEALPNASLEVGKIEQQFPKQDRLVITQAKAIPASYAASRPAQFSYIHFVAHATASSLSPLDSAVVLSPSPGHPERYKLYARDIVRNPIHADLVTISACYGSGVRAYAGEGLIGLSWAFLRAGAHRVIGALWEADDASTPQLMDHMYRLIRNNDSPDTALRSAKLSLLHSGSIYRKPLYWGAFQLYGGS